MVDFSRNFGLKLGVDFDIFGSEIRCRYLISFGVKSLGAGFDNLVCNCV